MPIKSWSKSEVFEENQGLTHPPLPPFKGGILAVDA